MRTMIIITTALFTGLAAAPVPHAPSDSQRSSAKLMAAKTGKERLSDKSSDEQRLDDCKVPEPRRTKTRPANCPEERS